MRRKTVIGINIATSASRSIGNLRWLLDRESVAAICGQASFIVKVERRGFYIHQEIAPGAGAWLVVCHTTLLPWNYHCVVPIFLIWNLKWTVSFEILAAHCRDYLTSRFSDSKWKKKLFFFHYFQCKQCRPDWRTWDFDFPMTTRTFVKKYTPGHVSPSSLKYTGDESKGPRAANASLKNNHQMTPKRTSMPWYSA